MKRGDIIIGAPPSPFNKPRPALVLQSFFAPEDEMITVALISSDLSHTSGLRIPINPTETNGLRKPSEIIIYNIQTIPLHRIGGLIGEADTVTMRRVDLALRLFLGLP